MQDEILSFYRDCQRGVQINEADEFVIASSFGRILGLVRLCFESETFVLRTMQVHPLNQRSGIGIQLLNRFDALVKERGIKNTYCMAFTHLEAFYQKIGFLKIETTQAPAFLQERLRAFSLLNPDGQAILMRKGDSIPATEKILPS